jgi:hypothetical protein
MLVGPLEAWRGVKGDIDWRAIKSREQGAGSR